MADCMRQQWDLWTKAIRRFLVRLDGGDDLVVIPVRVLPELLREITTSAAPAAELTCFRTRCGRRLRGTAPHEVRACLRCGLPFPRTRTDRLFCSAVCANTYWHRLKRARARRDG